MNRRWRSVGAALALPASAALAQLSGMTDADLGQAARGARYSYCFSITNSGHTPVTLGREKYDCGACATVRISRPVLEPGGTTGVEVSFYYAPEDPDTVDRNVYLTTDDSRRPGQWNIRVRASSVSPTQISATAPAVTVDSALASGSLTLRNTGPAAVTLYPVGAPAGIKWKPRFPRPLGPGDSLVVRFSAPREVFLRQTSLTFEARTDTKLPGGRISVPVVP
jgi:hypothetical protein